MREHPMAWSAGTGTAPVLCLESGAAARQEWNGSSGSDHGWGSGWFMGSLPLSQPQGIFQPGIPCMEAGEECIVKCGDKLPCSSE